VIPAAGIGSRMMPMTAVVPKELFPFGDRPIIHHIVDEAAGAGLTDICIVIRRGKEMIRDYFDRTAVDCDLHFVEQETPRGLGDAIHSARDFVANDRFVMLIPDQILLNRANAATQLVAADDGASIVSTVVRIPHDELPYFPGARGFMLRSTSSPDRFIVDRLLAGDVATDVRGFGRTIYPPVIFDYLGAAFVNPKSGEIDLLKTFEAIAGRIEHRAVLLEGRPADLGTLPGYYHYVCTDGERAA